MSENATSYRDGYIETIGQPARTATERDKRDHPYFTESSEQDKHFKYIASAGRWACAPTVHAVSYSDPTDASVE